jgi:hypothetical protein
MVAALEHAYGFYPRENVLDNGLMPAGIISQPHFRSANYRGNTLNGSQRKKPEFLEQGQSTFGQSPQSFLSRHLMPAPEKAVSRLEKAVKRCRSGKQRERRASS